jgi:hypothetical protein
MRFFGLSALVAIAVLSGRADADPATIWSMNAASCTPAQPAGTNNTVTGGAVTNITASQSFYCPIPYNLRQLGGTSNTLTLYYSGPSNWGCSGLCTGPHYVIASLVAMSRSTGAETTVVDLPSVTAGSFSSVSVAFSHAFDFDANVYYVRVRTLASTSFVQSFYAIALKDS